MKRLFRLGFAAHLGLVVLISAGAYLGMLPTHLPAVPHLDLLGHAILIGGLGFFLDGALERRPLAGGRGSLGGAIVLVVAGVEEWAQRFSPRRESSFLDYAADVVGVVFFVWLSRRVSERWALRASARA